MSYCVLYAVWRHFATVDFCSRRFQPNVQAVAEIGSMGQGRDRGQYANVMVRTRTDYTTSSGLVMKK